MTDSNDGTVADSAEEGATALAPAPDPAPAPPSVIVANTETSFGGAYSVWNSTENRDALSTAVEGMPKRGTLTASCVSNKREEAAVNCAPRAQQRRQLPGRSTGLFLNSKPDFQSDPFF